MTFGIDFSHSHDALEFLWTRIDKDSGSFWGGSSFVWGGEKSQGGTPGNSWSGCAARFFQSWPYFQTKKM